MKTIKLNLTTAFVLRKRLKDIANDFVSRTHYMQMVVEPEMVDDVLAKFKDSDFKKAVNTYELAMAASGRLSNAIEDVNNSGKKVLNAINTVNQMINTFTIIKNNLDANSVSKSRNPVTGNWETHTLQKITDADFGSEIVTLQQQKRKLEDTLAQHNGSVNFDFELEEELYAEIYGE